MSIHITWPKLASCFWYFIVIALMVTSSARALGQEQAHSDEPSAVQVTLYLPIVTSATASTSVSAPDIDNPMAVRMTQQMAQHTVANAPAVGDELAVVSASRPTKLTPDLYPLTGFDPNAPLADLKPLEPIIGNAAFVGLGEPVHTNGGSYLMKHRIFRFLVERMGFRVLGFENPFLWSERINQYVQSCQGPASESLRGTIFDVFASREVANLVQWMCEWNQVHPTDRVQFYGFDIQWMARENAEAIIAFLPQSSVPQNEQTVSGLRACDGVVTNFFPKQALPQERYDRCQGALAMLAAYFDAHEVAIRQQTPAGALDWARIHLRSEQAWQEELFYYVTDFPRSFTARDAGMADVALAIRNLRFPQARVALWAHDRHIGTNGVNLLAFDSPESGMPIMGDFLRQRLRDRYVTIGLTGFNLGVYWPGVEGCGLSPWRGQNAIEDILHATGYGYLLLDLNPADNRRATLLDPNATYSIIESWPLIPRDTFDALIYIENSPAMTPLALWPCS